MSTNATIRIEWNGKAREVRAGATVAALLVDAGLRPEVVAVEVNEALVRRADRDGRTLVDGDRVEIVTLVGGG